jgi:hypothetical protein
MKNLTVLGGGGGGGGDDALGQFSLEKFLKMDFTKIWQVLQLCVNLTK